MTEVTGRCAPNDTESFDLAITSVVAGGIAEYLGGGPHGWRLTVPVEGHCVRRGHRQVIGEVVFVWRTASSTCEPFVEVVARIGVDGTGETLASEVLLRHYHGADLGLLRETLQAAAARSSQITFGSVG